MSDLKYFEGTTDLKPFVDHVEFRLKYPMTSISEQAFFETQKYNYNTAYGHIYIGCLVAGNMAMNEINKLQHQLEIQTKRVENLKKSNEFYADINNCSTCNEDHHDGVKLPTMSGGLFVTGKLARSCQAIDQELEKELEGAK